MKPFFIAHRINTLEGLKEIYSQYAPGETGIEFDIRDDARSCIVTHDAFTPAIELETFVSALHPETFLAVNIKSEGIEHHVLALLEKYGLRKFFLLDCSFPVIVKLSRQGESRIAVRYSEFETIETVLRLSGNVGWVWADCFTKFSLSRIVEQQLHDSGFKICLVGPDLQGRPGEIEQYRKILSDEEIAVDAVCTKAANMKRWS